MACVGRIVPLPPVVFACTDLAGCSIADFADVGATEGVLSWNGATFLSSGLNGIFDSSNESASTAISSYDLGSNLTVADVGNDHLHTMETNTHFVVNQASFAAGGGASSCGGGCCTSSGGLGGPAAGHIIFDSGNILPGTGVEPFVILEVSAFSSAFSESSCTGVIYSYSESRSRFAAVRREVAEIGYRQIWQGVNPPGTDVENSLVFTDQGADLRVTNDFLLNGANGAINDQLQSTGAGSPPIWGPPGSDLALKEDVTPLESCLEACLELLPKTFRFHNSPQDRVGFVAQEVQKAVPSVVSERSDGYLGIYYEDLVGVLVSAIQELNERIERIGS